VERNWILDVDGGVELRTDDASFALITSMSEGKASMELLLE